MKEIAPGRGCSISLSGFFYVSGESLVAGNCPLKEALSVPHSNYNLYPSILQNALPAPSVLLTSYHLLTCRTVYTSCFVFSPLRGLCLHYTLQGPQT